MSFRKVGSSLYPDQNCALSEYIHEESGLRHYHLESSFPEMIFALSVPTPPEDDTGMPHILEHLTLCGSEKYPVQDPFMAMLNRSVAHDMNAMTSKLHTVYHFATTLQVDFNNLSDLYLDLVFNPLLRQEDFEQEGWRLERSLEGEWNLKGVVLNEMKGVYANPQAQFVDALMEHLAPNTPAARSSGGHPVAIAGLSYERLQDFHRRHYTPKHATVVTSGAIDLDVLHAQLDDTLTRHSKNAIAPLPTPVAPPARALRPSALRATATHVETSVPGTPSARPELLWTYLGSGPQTPKEELFDQMMTAALFDSSATLLQGIEQKWQCVASAQYIYHNVMETTGKVGLAIHVRNVDPQHQHMLAQDVDAMWDAIMAKGVSAEEWQSAVAAFSRSVRDQYGTSPAGTVLDIATTAALRKNPLDNANNLQWLTELQNTVPTLEDVQKWCQRFRANARPILQSVPQENLLAQWNTQENALVEGMIMEGHVPQNKAQVAKASIDQLPCLNESDLVAPVRAHVSETVVPATPSACAHTHFEADSATAVVRIVWDMQPLGLSAEELMLFQMWTAFAPRLGTDTKTIDEQGLWEEQFGLDVRWGLKSEANRNGGLGVFAVFSAGALHENIQQVCSSLTDRLRAVPMLETDRWRTLFTQVRDGWARSQDNADRVVSESKINAAAPYSDKGAFAAASHHYFLAHRNRWIEHAINNPAQAQAEFAAMLDKLKNAPVHVIAIGPAEHGVDEAAATVAQTLALQPTWNNLVHWNAWPQARPTVAPPQFMPAALMVNHCIRTQPGPKWNDFDAASVKVALNLVDPKLHELVREHGGAYGVSTSHTRQTISFASFRDPHVEETFQAFAQVPTLLQDIVATEDGMRLREAKLALFKTFTTPKSSFDAAQDACDRALTGLTLNDENWVLQQIAAVTWKDVAAATQKWLQPTPKVVSTWAVVPASTATPVVGMNKKKIAV